MPDKVSNPERTIPPTISDERLGRLVMGYALMSASSAGEKKQTELDVMNALDELVKYRQRSRNEPT